MKNPAEKAKSKIVGSSPWGRAALYAAKMRKNSGSKKSTRYLWIIFTVPGFAILLPMCSMMAIGGTGPPPEMVQQNPYSQAGPSDIDPVVWQAYVNAASNSQTLHPTCVLRPSILAGIGWKETMHGTFGGSAADTSGKVTPAIIGIPLNGSNNTKAISDSDNGFYDKDQVWDRAVGPMQFIPSSWRIYGLDGNGDQLVDPHNIFDAALAAANHLCASSPTDMNQSENALRKALLSYNQSSSYVNSVMNRISYYDTASPRTSASPAALLSNPNLQICEPSIRDVETGQIDQRVIAMLTLLTQKYSLYICPLKSGHYQCVGGGSLRSRPNCSESHHWYGRAVDISLVNGKPVRNDNKAAQEIIEMIATLPKSDPLRPSGVGSPWPQYSALPGFFNDADHEGHLHLGWCGPRWSNGTYKDSCL